MLKHILFFHILALSTPAAAAQSANGEAAPEPNPPLSTEPMSPEPTSPEPMSLEPVRLEPAFIASSPTLPAIAMPLRRATVTSPSNRPIRRITAKIGRSFRAGEPLIHLDSNIAEPAARAARARADATGELETAKAERAFATTRLERLLDAEQTGAAGAMEILTAKAAVARADAALQHAYEQAGIATIEAQRTEAELAQLTVRAPFDGIITVLPVAVGQSPGPNDPLFEIVSLDTLRVELHLPITDALELDTGSAYHLFATGITHTDSLTAVLDAVVPTIDPAARTVRCVFLIDNTDLGLPAGFHVSTRPANTTANTTAQARAVLPYDPAWPTNRPPATILTQTTP
ncbi:MAG: HlyD family efflux transporter periplasmic adaptor subunit [Planctomycetota bacterium]